MGYCYFASTNDSSVYFFSFSTIWTLCPNITPMPKVLLLQSSRILLCLRFYHNRHPITHYYKSIRTEIHERLFLWGYLYVRDYSSSKKLPILPLPSKVRAFPSHCLFSIGRQHCTSCIISKNFISSTLDRIQQRIIKRCPIELHWSIIVTPLMSLYFIESSLKNYFQTNFIDSGCGFLALSSLPYDMLQQRIERSVSNDTYCFFGSIETSYYPQFN